VQNKRKQRLKNWRKLMNTIEILQGIIINIIEDDSVVIDENTDLIIDLEMDSLDIINLYSEIENKFNINLDEAENVFELFSSVGILCDTIDTLCIK